MALGRDRVQGKIRELERRKAQTMAKLSQLKLSYEHWQVMKNKWAQHLDSSKHTTQDTQRQLVEAQRAISDAAERKVIADAESESDWGWDDWPGDEGFAG